MQHERMRVLGLGLALLAGLALAFNNIAITIVYAHGSNAPSVVFLRYVVFMLLLLVWFLAGARSLKMARQHYLPAVISGLFTVCGSLALLSSFNYIPVSLAVLILYTFPILTSLLQSVIERRWPGLVQIVCLFAALGGLALALEIGDFELDPRGILLGGMAAAGFAASFVTSMRFLGDADSNVCTFYMSLAGLAATGAAVYISGGLKLPELVSEGVVALLVVCLCFSIAFACMYRGIQLVGATPTAMLMNLEPVFTIVLATLFLAEALTVPRIAGGLIVLAAVLVSQLVDRARHEPIPIRAVPGVVPEGEDGTVLDPMEREAAAKDTPRQPLGAGG